MPSDEHDDMIPLAVELMTASTGDAFDYLVYCKKRLDEEDFSQDDLYRLVEVLAAFGGNAIASWAEDLHVDFPTLMQSLALDIQDP